jgi:PAS domain S-box-containing protein
VSLTPRVERLARTVLDVPEQAWSRRHHAVVVALAVAIAGVGVATALQEGDVVVGAATAVWALPWLALAMVRIGRELRTIAATIGLFTCASAILYRSEGSLAASSAVVVAVGVIWAYRSWLPFLTAACYVVASHLLIGALLHPAYSHWQAAIAEEVIIGGTVVVRLVNEVARRDAERLRRQNQLILEAAGEGIFGLDIDGRVSFVNPAAARLLRWSAAELVGRDMHESIHHSRPDGTPYPADRCPINRSLADGTPHRVVNDHFFRRDGSSFPVQYVATPLRESGELVGAVVMFVDLTEREQAQAYRGEVSRLTEEQAASRETVYQLQEAVQPAMLSVDGAELGVHYLAADPTEPTGGDLYDWVVLPDGDLHLAVVDVVGKGVAATKDALTVTHALRLLALDGYPLGDMIRRADALLTAYSPDLVATAQVVRFTPTTGRVQVAGAGHPPALVVSADGSTRYVTASGIPVGWPGAGSEEVVELDLERSDVLVMYTDGLVEAKRDILVGFRGLEDAARRIVDYPAPQLARALVDRALAGSDRRDDTLALVLRRRAPLPDTGRRAIGPFHHRFTGHEAAVSVARHLLGAWLNEQPVDPAVVDDVLLAAAELCTNAVTASPGSPVVLDAWLDGDALGVEVRDGGPGLVLPVLRHDEIPDLDAEAGRGLYLVRALVDDLDAGADDGGAWVRFVKRAVTSAAR